MKELIKKYLKDTNLTKYIVYSISLLVLCSYLIISVSPDLKELIIIPLISKIGKVALFFSSIFIFLRLRDKILDHTFKISDLTLATGIYFGLSILGLSIGLSLIIM